MSNSMSKICNFDVCFLLCTLNLSDFQRERPDMLAAYYCLQDMWSLAYFCVFLQESCRQSWCRFIFPSQEGGGQWWRGRSGIWKEASTGHNNKRPKVRCCDIISLRICWERRCYLTQLASHIAPSKGSTISFQSVNVIDFIFYFY